jgi:hypothetical protein
MMLAGVAGMEDNLAAVSLNKTPILIVGNAAKIEDLNGKGSASHAWAQTES